MILLEVDLMEGVRHVPYSTSLVVDVLLLSRHCRSRSMEQVPLYPGRVSHAGAYLGEISRRRTMGALSLIHI